MFCEPEAQECLSYHIMTTNKQHNQNQLWEERVHFILYLDLTAHPMKSGQFKTGNWKQELKPRRNAIYWFAPHGSFILLCYTILDYLAWGVYVGWGPDPSWPIINQENALQSCLQSIWMEAFLNWRSSSLIPLAFIKLAEQKNNNNPPPKKYNTKIGKSCIVVVLCIMTS